MRAGGVRRGKTINYAESVGFPIRVILCLKN